MSLLSNGLCGLFLLLFFFFFFLDMVVPWVWEGRTGRLGIAARGVYEFELVGRVVVGRRG